ncbi:MAG: SufE family protein [Bdellovibrionales bacterium]|nr:SufE family protein [Bdellovibrionales bacterium]
MDKVEQRAKEILNEFSSLLSWEEKYKKIIQMGKSSLPLDTKYKTKEWLVKGCQSQVWLHAFQDQEGKVVFRADSDALITKGLVALLLTYYSGLSPQEIIAHSVPSFFEKLDLKNHLTPTRVGGLFSMVRQIQYYARAFTLISKDKSI